MAATEQEARELFNAQYSINNVQLKQDEDCLDTWFSSWLWPFEVFKGYSHPDNADIKYYYPTNTLVTAPEIIFFWVARMMMFGMFVSGDPAITIGGQRGPQVPRTGVTQCHGSLLGLRDSACRVR